MVNRADDTQGAPAAPFSPQKDNKFFYKESYRKHVLDKSNGEDKIEEQYILFDVEYVRLGDIDVVWSDAQRDKEWPHVKDIIDNFSMDSVIIPNVIFVKERQKYHPTTGQHTVEALLYLFGPDVIIPVKICKGHTKKDAAKVTRNIDKNTKKFNTVAAFNIAVIAEDPLAVVTSKAIIKVGYEIKNSSKKGTLKAVGAASDSINYDYDSNTYDDYDLTDWLWLSKDGWGMSSKGVEAVAIKGGALFCRYHRGEYDYDRMTKAMDNVDPGSFKARVLELASALGCKQHIAYYKKLHQLYNETFRSHAKARLPNVID